MSSGVGGPRRLLLPGSGAACAPKRLLERAAYSASLHCLEGDARVPRPQRLQVSRVAQHVPCELQLAERGLARQQRARVCERKRKRGRGRRGRGRGGGERGRWLHGWAGRRPTADGGGPAGQPARSPSMLSCRPRQRLIRSTSRDVAAASGSASSSCGEEGRRAEAAQHAGRHVNSSHRCRSSAANDGCARRRSWPEGRSRFQAPCVPFWPIHGLTQGVSS